MDAAFSTPQVTQKRTHEQPEAVVKPTNQAPYSGGFQNFVRGLQEIARLGGGKTG